MTTKKYDIIGDIHGHAATLEKLLEKLGYALLLALADCWGGHYGVFLFAVFLCGSVACVR